MSNLIRGNSDFPIEQAPDLNGHFRDLVQNGHGWIVPRADGTRSRCGGPSLCRTCHMEKLLLNTSDRVTIMEGFNLKPGDKLLLIGPPHVDPSQYGDLYEYISGRFPEVHITIVSGFTGVQVHKSEPTE